MECASAVILAAGKGKRTGLPYPKVLHPLCGKPMIQWVVETISQSLVPHEIIIVIPPEYKADFSRLLTGPITFVTQPEPLGTGHALQTALHKSNQKKGTVFVACGDTPLLSSDICQTMFSFHRQNKSDVTLLTTNVPDPAGYGRVVRNPKRRIQKIVEERDASPKEKVITEINAGTYCFERNALETALPNLTQKNVQHEYYLTDCIAWLIGRRKKVSVFPIVHWEAALGVNNLKQMAEADKYLNLRLIEKHQSNGVYFTDPATVYLDSDVQIGSGTTIHPFTFLENGAKIGTQCKIGPSAQIIASTIGHGTSVQMSIVDQSDIADRCVVGPFAYLRPGTQLQSGVRVGDFVEVKKSCIGPGSKVPHLSYIGDAEIGANVNIGAGTITCNYDGKEKHKTVIEDGAFIGSNTNLIAPLRIGKKAITGAGSVVRHDVAAGTVVAGVPAEIIKKREEIHGG